MDAHGDVLQTGDGVKSIRTFDAGHCHRGVVTAVDIVGNRISVEHRAGCCTEGLSSEDCEPRFWIRVINRPTAWARILGDDE